VVNFNYVSSPNAWFPSLRIRSAVPVSPLSVEKVRKNYVHPKEFRKNSEAYVKNNVLCFRKFAVAIDPFI